MGASFIATLDSSWLHFSGSMLIIGLFWVVADDCYAPKHMTEKEKELEERNRRTKKGVFPL
jgi:hypothetical protein